jgi:hypothetical protein
MARPLRRVIVDLSIRLGIIVTELERLPIGYIAEYIARLSDKKPSADVQSRLLAVFGDSTKRKH